MPGPEREPAGNVSRSLALGTHLAITPGKEGQAMLEGVLLFFVGIGALLV